MTCSCGGTVWFDHYAKQWRHGSGSCSKPFPRACGEAVAKPEQRVRRVTRRPAAGS